MREKGPVKKTTLLFQAYAGARSIATSSKGIGWTEEPNDPRTKTKLDGPEFSVSSTLRVHKSTVSSKNLEAVLLNAVSLPEYCGMVSACSVVESTEPEIWQMRMKWTTRDDQDTFESDVFLRIFYEGSSITLVSVSAPDYVQNTQGTPRVDTFAVGFTDADDDHYELFLSAKTSHWKISSKAGVDKLVDFANEYGAQIPWISSYGRAIRITGHTFKAGAHKTNLRYMLEEDIGDEDRASPPTAITLAFLETMHPVSCQIKVTVKLAGSGMPVPSIAALGSCTWHSAHGKVYVQLLHPPTSDTMLITTSVGLTLSERNEIVVNGGHAIPMQPKEPDSSMILLSDKPDQSKASIPPADSRASPMRHPPSSVQSRIATPSPLQTTPYKITSSPAATLLRSPPLTSTPSKRTPFSPPLMQSPSPQKVGLKSPLKSPSNTSLLKSPPAKAAKTSEDALTLTGAAASVPRPMPESPVVNVHQASMRKDASLPPLSLDTDLLTPTSTLHPRIDSVSSIRSYDDLALPSRSSSQASPSGLHKTRSTESFLYHTPRAASPISEQHISWAPKDTAPGPKPLLPEEQPVSRDHVNGSFHKEKPQVPESRDLYVTPEKRPASAISDTPVNLSVPTIPKKESLFQATLRRNYVYFLSLIQEPDAKWRPIQDTGNVNVTKLQSPDPTLTVLKADATFVGPGIWDVLGHLQSPNTQKEWDTTLMQVNLVQRIDSFSSLWHVVYQESGSWPLRPVPRDAVFVRTIYRSPSSAHVFDFSVDDTRLFEIPAPAPDHVRAHIDSHGFCIEALSPTTTQITLIDQSDQRGWVGKSNTPYLLESLVSRLGDSILREGTLPILVSLSHATLQETLPRRGSYVCTYKSDSDGDSGDLATCEIRCDSGIWAHDLDISVLPDPSRVTVTSRHQLVPDSGLWITIQHTVPSKTPIKVDIRPCTAARAQKYLEPRLEENSDRGAAPDNAKNEAESASKAESVSNSASKAESASNSEKRRKTRIVIVNNERVPVAVEALAKDQVKSLTERKRIKARPIALDQLGWMKLPPALARTDSATSQASTSNVATTNVYGRTLFIGSGKNAHQAASDAMRGASVDKPKAHRALEGLAQLQRIHAESGLDDEFATWTLVIDRSLTQVRKRIDPLVSPVVPLYRADKVFQGVTAEQVAACVSDIPSRPVWDKRIAEATTIESYGHGILHALLKSHPLFPFNARVMNIVQAVGVTQIPSASSISSTSSVHFVATTSVPLEEISGTDVESVVLLEGWIIETLDPYATPYVIPSTRVSFFSCVDHGGNGSNAFANLINPSNVLNPSYPRLLSTLGDLVTSKKTPTPPRVLYPQSLLVIDGPLHEDPSRPLDWVVRKSPNAHQGVIKSPYLDPVLLTTDFSYDDAVSRSSFYMSPAKKATVPSPPPPTITVSQQLLDLRDYPEGYAIQAFAFLRNTAALPLRLLFFDSFEQKPIPLRADVMQIPLPSLLAASLESQAPKFHVLTLALDLVSFDDIPTLFMLGARIDLKIVPLPAAALRDKDVGMGVETKGGLEEYAESREDDKSKEARKGDKSEEARKDKSEEARKDKSEEARKDDTSEEAREDKSKEARKDGKPGTGPPTDTGTFSVTFNGISIKPTRNDSFSLEDVLSGDDLLSRSVVPHSKYKDESRSVPFAEPLARRSELFATHPDADTLESPEQVTEEPLQEVSQTQSESIEAEAPHDVRPFFLWAVMLAVLGTARTAVIDIVRSVDYMRRRRITLSPLGVILWGAVFFIVGLYYSGGRPADYVVEPHTSGELRNLVASSPSRRWYAVRQLMHLPGPFEVHLVRRVN